MISECCIMVTLDSSISFNMITYRKAEKNDKQAFGKLEREYYKAYQELGIDVYLEPVSYEKMPEDSLTASFETFLHSANFFFVAELGGLVIGYIYIEVKENEHPELYKVQKRGYVNTIIISENYRGQGIGTELLKQGTSWLVSQGITVCILDVMSENKAGISLYEGLGFKHGLMKMYKKI